MTTLLELARTWRNGALYPVHPEVGSMLNAELVRAGEVPVRHAEHSVDPCAPTLVDLIRREHDPLSKGYYGAAHLERAREDEYGALLGRLRDVTRRSVRARATAVQEAPDAREH